MIVPVLRRALRRALIRIIGPQSTGEDARRSIGQYHHHCCTDESADAGEDVPSTKHRGLLSQPL